MPEHNKTLKQNIISTFANHLLVLNYRYTNMEDIHLNLLELIKFTSIDPKVFNDPTQLTTFSNHKIQKYLTKKLPHANESTKVRLPDK